MLSYAKFFLGILEYQYLMMYIIHGIMDEYQWNITEAELCV